MLAWVQHSSVWRAGTVVDEGGGDSPVSVLLDEGEVLLVSDSEGVQPRNADDAADAEDIATLQHLNEPSILHALAVRYARDAIYTRCGSILIATNPWRRVQALTSRETLCSYVAGCESDPHPFAIARVAYAGALRGERQSILVSGESGSGKTETTKTLLAYLSAAARAGSNGMQDLVATMLLDANPVLEAFGNAKTLRNDNSSRFGKFVDITFSETGTVISGAVCTYLLEKSRAVSIPSGERSFHIFYQLLARPEGMLRRAALAEAQTPEPFPSLEGSLTLLGEHGDACTTVSSIDDSADGEALEAALRTLGLSDDELSSLYHALSATLLCSNLNLGAGNPGEGDACVEDSPTLLAVAQQLGVLAPALAAALTKQRLKMGGEMVTSPRTIDQASRVRHALAKAVFAGTFRFLVSRINRPLEGRDESSCGVSIGVLDIFGFESFPTNGFEQMCINYANEKLQGQFNAVTFEAQRHEYAAEGVPWTAGAHSSNTRTLQALEGKLGILSLLHEQCRLPRGDDGKFVEAIRSAWKDHDAVRVPHLPVNAFCVAHYAGEVTYSCAGFVEKDRDALPEDVINLLSTSTSEFMRGLIVRAGCVHAGTGGCDRVGSSGSGASSSLGLQFKSQLNSLLGKVQQGASHYIRCVNPNATKHPGIFDWPTMLQQLRCSGLMDAVRVAREGHASRTPCADFVARYRCLAPTVATTSPAALLDAATEGPRLNSLDKQEEGEMRAAAHQLIDKLRTSAGLLEVLGCQEGAIAGRTKVFLQLGTLRALEAARTSVIAKACNLIQSSARRQAACLLLSRARDAVSMIQCVARGAIVRALARELRLRRAVTVIQSAARRHIARLSLARACAATRVLQRVARGATARALRRTLRREHACTVLLRGARHMLKQRRVAMAYTLAHAATVISAMWRSRIARACFKHAQRTALATQCTYQSACQRGTVDHADLASAPMDALPLAAGRLKVDAETIDEPQVASTHTAQGQFLQDKAVTIDSLTTQLQQLSLHALVQPAPESALSCDAGRGKENAPPHMAITTGDTHMRLEKVINRLLGQLRDERMQRVTQSAVLNSLEQLRESVAAKADSLSGLVHELQAPLYVSLDAAIERLSTVAADMYHATDTVDAAEAANAAARQNETIAEEQYARAAAHIEVLESRVAEQASLITALTRRAQRPREEATACKQVKSARDTTEETTAELEAWTAIPFAGITAFTKRVKRVASAASSLYIDHGDAASHTDESTGSLSNGFDFAYVRLLEKELALALQDPHMDIYENVPRAMLNRQHHSNDSPAHSACNLALSRMREQASVTALHEDIQFGRRKTIRLEKIVMMMTSELRELKLQRASMKRDAGDRALADLKQTRQELNIALADSRVALGILTDAVQKELKSARAHFSISGNSNG